MFCEESLGKNNKCDFRAFPELRSVHEFYHLKEFFNNFGTSEPFTGWKKKNKKNSFINLNKQRL